MDVVRRNIGSLGGSVSVSSTPGRGHDDHDPAAAHARGPRRHDRERGRRAVHRPARIRGRGVQARRPATCRMVVNQPSLVAVRGEHLPIVRLEDVVRASREGEAPRPEPLCLVVEVDGRRAALLVDALIGQQQLVVKSLDTNLHSVRGRGGRHDPRRRARGAHPRRERHHRARAPRGPPGARVRRSRSRRAADARPARHRPRREFPFTRSTSA